MINFGILFPTFPGLDEKHRTPFTPLALRVHLITGSNLNLVEVSSQGVKDHDRTLLRVNLMRRERRNKQ